MALPEDSSEKMTPEQRKCLEDYYEVEKPCRMGSRS